MKIAYISTRYKWEEHGVPRGFYDSLVRKGHKVVYLIEKDMRICRDPSVDQVWVVFSGKIFEDKEAALLRQNKTLIGFNFTQRNALPYRHQYHRMYSTTIDPGTIFLPPAIDPGFHRDYEGHRDIGHAFFGWVKGHRKVWLERLPRIVPFNMTQKGEHLIRALNRVQVGMDFETPEISHTIPHRLLEYAACGAMVCCPKRDDVSFIFHYGEEVVEFKGELPAYDPAVARAARDRCLREHTYDQRVEAILSNKQWDEVSAS